MEFEIYDKLYYSGNILLLRNPSIAVFCSRIIPMTLYFPALELMKKLMDLNITITGSWHSNVEQRLLKNRKTKSQSKLIMFLAKGIEHYELPEILKDDYDNNKILITSFWKDTKRISLEKSKIRNQSIIAKAEKILFLNIHENGNLNKLFDQSIALNKKVFMLDHPSNEQWITKGAIPLSKYNLEEIS
jgi:predicted Rossmann fold nucleotide-binding protein DprA/Smf involved in DNA uptake